MTTITATIKDRRVEVDVPADWPDGIEVEIHPRQQPANHNPDEMSGEEIARALAAMDQIEPFEMSEEELTAWEAERQALRQREKAEFAARAEELRSRWQ